MLADAVIQLSPSRPERSEQERRTRRISFDDNVRGWPLRMTEFLRERLRPTWLRLKRRRGADGERESRES